MVLLLCYESGMEAIIVIINHHSGSNQSSIVTSACCRCSRRVFGRGFCWRCCAGGRPKGKATRDFTDLEDLAILLFTLIVVFLEMWAAVLAGVEVAIAFQYSKHRLFVLLGRTFGVISGKSMEDGPRVVTQWLSIEGTLPRGATGFQTFPEIGEGTFLTDKFLAIVLHRNRFNYRMTDMK